MNKISGIFLSFSDKELNAIYDFLELNKYSRDSAGLKDFIFDSIADENESEKNPIAEVIYAIQDNPILVQSAFGLARKILSKK